MPAHVVVDAADAPKQLGSGTQHQVIGVAEHHLRADSARSRGVSPVTVARVPTAMNAGVSMVPCAVTMPRRALEPDRARSRGKVADMARTVSSRAAAPFRVARRGRVCEISSA